MFEESLAIAASQMSLLVFLQVTRVTKAFVTVSAGERLLSCVEALMHGQVAGLTEAFPAHRAAVRLLPRVHPVVFLVVTRVSERATTEQAGVMFSVISLEHS